LEGGEESPASGTFQIGVSVDKESKKVKKKNNVQREMVHRGSGGPNVYSFQKKNLKKSFKKSILVLIKKKNAWNIHKSFGNCARC